MSSFELLLLLLSLLGDIADEKGGNGRANHSDHPSYMQSKEPDQDLSSDRIWFLLGHPNLLVRNLQIWD